MQHWSLEEHDASSARHAGPPVDVPVHALPSQRPLQQWRFWVQKPCSAEQTCWSKALSWQYAPTPSSWQLPVQQSASFTHAAPLDVHAVAPPDEEDEHAARTMKRAPNAAHDRFTLEGSPF